MEKIAFNIIFFIITMYILIKAIGYGLYEFQKESNKIGGIVVIGFSILVVLFANFMIWIK